ncbi:large conductance mechanosensitive channel protein MscL [Bdellovibrio sp. HCB337]|uniref:large conductance mechanosensitive channel protein MscL n=1 Tax=Bdellovibrio sp. HCB337 TaxID=3394358 RepID=UPI0039A74102
MWNEFKAFISKGNVLDLAVGIIIGAAFGKIVSSFVADVLMPVVSLGLGKVDFTNLFVALNGQTYETLADAKKAAAPTLNYGVFLNSLIDFAIIGFAVFLIVKMANKVQKPAPAAVTTKECPFCASMIPLKATRCPQCTSTL